ncbi:hypothetical protein U1Q18_016238, partial [Sarracenia purpurea var. burkii]
MSCLGRQLKMDQKNGSRTPSLHRQVSEHETDSQPGATSGKNVGADGGDAFATDGGDGPGHSPGVGHSFGPARADPR